MSRGITTFKSKRIQQCTNCQLLKKQFGKAIEGKTVECPRHERNREYKDDVNSHEKYPMSLTVTHVRVNVISVWTSGQCSTKSFLLVKRCVILFFWEICYGFFLLKPKCLNFARGTFGHIATIRSGSPQNVFSGQFQELKRLAYLYKNSICWNRECSASWSSHRHLHVFETE